MLLLDQANGVLYISTRWDVQGAVGAESESLSEPLDCRVARIWGGALSLSKHAGTLYFCLFPNNRCLPLSSFTNILHTMRITIVMISMHLDQWLPHHLSHLPVISCCWRDHLQQPPEAGIYLISIILTLWQMSTFDFELTGLAYTHRIQGQIQLLSCCLS